MFLVREKKDKNQNLKGQWLFPNKNYIQNFKERKKARKKKKLVW
jgi:hypothetical protein